MLGCAARVSAEEKSMTKPNAASSKKTKSKAAAARPKRQSPKEIGAKTQHLQKAFISDKDNKSSSRTRPDYSKEDA